jgi:hypothetical protein
MVSLASCRQIQRPSVKIIYKCKFRTHYSATSINLNTPKPQVYQISIHIHYYFIIIGIQPLGRSGQRPDLSQVTGMALVRCILGKFLGVVCHCFPPRLDVPTFATRCPHVRHDAREPSGGRWNCGREYCPVILPK